MECSYNIINVVKSILRIPILLFRPKERKTMLECVKCLKAFMNNKVFFIISCLYFNLFLIYNKVFLLLFHAFILIYF